MRQVHIRRHWRAKGAYPTEQQPFGFDSARQECCLIRTLARTQMAQTAVCNRHHWLDQQLCRWPLLSLDRLDGEELILTQELIAIMLGVCRKGVTEGAGLPNLRR